MAESPQPSPSARGPSLTDVLKALSSGGVDFVICGGVACILHGVSRVTADLDIAVRMDRKNLERLIDVARELGLKPRIPEPMESLLDERRREEWIETKHAQVFTMVARDNPFQLDVFLRYPVRFDDLKSRSEIMRGDNITLRVSSKEDLIAAKRAAGRELDFRDVADLERLIRHEAQ